jgi:hypothetical protein
MLVERQIISTTHVGIIKESCNIKRTQMLQVQQTHCDSKWFFRKANMGWSVQEAPAQTMQPNRRNDKIHQIWHSPEEPSCKPATNRIWGWRCGLRMAGGTCAEAVSLVGARRRWGRHSCDALSWRPHAYSGRISGAAQTQERTRARSSERRRRSTRPCWRKPGEAVETGQLKRRWGTWTFSVVSHRWRAAQTALRPCASGAEQGSTAASCRWGRSRGGGKLGWAECPGYWWRRRKGGENWIGTRDGEERQF